MAKYCGKIGFSMQERNPGNVWDEHVIERTYTGEVLNESFQNEQTQEKLLDELAIKNEISIIADGFAMKNFHTIKYATIMGVRWRVKSVTVNFPRLRLSIGGVYNGPESDEEEATETRLFATDIL